MFPQNDDDVFADKYAFYRFCFDDPTHTQAQKLVSIFLNNVTIDQATVINSLFENLPYLLQKAPEATLRQILRKR